MSKKFVTQIQCPHCEHMPQGLTPIEEVEDALCEKCGKPVINDEIREGLRDIVEGIKNGTFPIGKSIPLKGALNKEYSKRLN